MNETAGHSLPREFCVITDSDECKRNIDVGDGQTNGRRLCVRRGLQMRSCKLYIPVPLVRWITAKTLYFAAIV